MDSSVCYKVNVHVIDLSAFVKNDRWLIYIHVLVVFYKRITFSFPSIFNFFLCRYTPFSSQCSKLRFFSKQYNVVVDPP